MHAFNIVTCGLPFRRDSPACLADLIPSRPPFLPVYLVSEEEVPGLLHPVIATRTHRDGPPDGPVQECMLIHEEDHFEKDTDEYPSRYCGLVPLVAVAGKDDDDGPVSELPAGERGPEPERWDFPATFACPDCGDGGDVEPVNSHYDRVNRSYFCMKCHTLLYLEPRFPIVNAAALIAPFDPFK